jgi:hypothetical protein
VYEIHQQDSVMTTLCQADFLQAIASQRCTTIA